MGVAFFSTMGILIALMIKRRDHPTNLILLGVFVSMRNRRTIVNFVVYKNCKDLFWKLQTLVQAYTVGVVVSMYDTTVVLEALFITLTVLLSLTAYTFQTKRDFSFLGFGWVCVCVRVSRLFQVLQLLIFFSLYRLFIGLWCLILGGLMQIFIQSTTMELIISIGGALLFCLFIIFDTQLIMHTLSPEEYILATINLYLDIINLFLHILRALAISRQWTLLIRSTKHRKR